MRTVVGVLGFACAATLCAGTAFGTPTPQQLCDNARIIAWKVYTSCVDTVVAKDAKGVSFDKFKAFWKCRHAYVQKWTAFQTKASLAGTTCIGNRFTDNSDQTVTDNLSGLMWEQKDDTNDIDDIHEEGNAYSWSAGVFKGDGTAYTTFLTGAGTGVNVVGFAGAADWRLPTLAELQTIMKDFTCTGPGAGATCKCTEPCVELALGTPIKQNFPFWSATGHVAYAEIAWWVSISVGDVASSLKSSLFHVRAVRGGL